MRVGCGASARHRPAAALPIRSSLSFGYFVLIGVDHSERRRTVSIGGLRLHGLQISQQPCECLLVGIVLLPLPEVTNMPLLHLRRPALR